MEIFFLKNITWLVRSLRLIALIISLLTLNSCNEMKSDQSKSNYLIHESSPYLLQHAYNPVDWYPWGEEALKKARAEDKMIIISIGYAACHWCHVMEHESFEDDSIAQIMNDHFISIKVDREERPDIDQVYMSACQLVSNNSCGWPLNAFALPDGKPVWAGTYFPKKRWKDILLKFKDLYLSDKSSLQRSAQKITKGISVLGSLEFPNTEDEISSLEITEFVDSFLYQMDMIRGGRQGRPKFPMPNNYLMLLEYYTLFGNEQIKEAITVTLDNMAAGGIYDQLGGGFARYSVDEYWLVPHFEKMLYDNAQLIDLYAQTYKLTKNPLYLKIVRETSDFLIKDFGAIEGGFYCSYDADSEGVEGKFYTWSSAEIDSILGADAETLKDYYDVTDSGNWEGVNILHRIRHETEIARKHNLTNDELISNIKSSKVKMLEVRKMREKPRLDDKIIASWNGLAISGLVSAFEVTGDHKYLEAAEQNAQFIMSFMIDEDFRLWRNYKEGNTTINGFLDDYAMIINGLISLYQISFEIEYLDMAMNLTKYTLDHFSNDSNQMFHFTSDLDPPLIAKTTAFSDNVIPSGNSMMAQNLYSLGIIYGNDNWKGRAIKMVQNVIPSIRSSNQPSFYSNWIRLMMKVIQPPFEIVIMGDRYYEKRMQFASINLPSVLFMGGVIENLPLLENKLQDETTIYVCKNKVCKLPVYTMEEALKQLN